MEQEHEIAIRLANKLLDEPNADPDDDLRLLARQFLRAKELAPRLIVDLLEMRVSTMHKYQSKDEKIQDGFKYNFFNSVIANLCDKYKVRQEEIDEVLRYKSKEELAL